MGNLSDNGVDTGAAPRNMDSEPLPKGRYLAKMVKSELKITSSNTGLRLACEWDVLEPGYEDRKVWSNFNVKNQNEKAQQIGLGMLSACAQACGKPGIPDDSSDLHDIPHVVALRIEEGSGGYGPKNVVSGFYPAAGAGGAALGGTLPTTVSPAFDADEIPDDIFSEGN